MTNGEYNQIIFTRVHDVPPKAVFTSYLEKVQSVDGEPKQLKVIQPDKYGFAIALSSYDGKSRNFNWIAIW